MTKAKRLLCGGLTVLLCLIAVLGLLPISVMATGSCSLLINSKDDSKPIGGVFFHVYRVADVIYHDDVNYHDFTLSDKFSESSVAIGPQMTNAEWSNAAVWLAAYVMRNKISADYEGSADFNGRVYFGNMDPGVYLVTGDSLTVNDMVYTPQTFCVVLPDKNAVGDNVTANVKFSKYLTPQYGSLMVKKTVTGSGDTEREWTFRITLNTLLNGQYGDLYFTNGIAECKLKHGGVALATGLPAGTAYMAEELEANKDGYTTMSSGDMGFILANATVTVEFVNDIPFDPDDEVPSDDAPPESGDEVDEVDVVDDAPPVLDVNPNTGDFSNNNSLFCFIAIATGIICIVIWICKTRRKV